jgi:pimeloyl-ACP methyl ester carboxylesterase
VSTFTLIATHGFGDDRSAFAAQAEPLRESGFDLITWDLPGHGTTGARPAAYSPGTGRTALAELVGRHPRPAVLLGHSLGGYLSLAHAVLRPDDVAGLILVSTGPGYRNAEARSQWNAYVDGMDLPLMRQRPGVARICHQDDSVVIDSLAGIRVPVLQLIGASDRRYAAGSQYLASKLPDVETVSVSGAGHHPHRTHADEVNRHILLYLGQRFGAAPLRADNGGFA